MRRVLAAFVGLTLLSVAAVLSISALDTAATPTAADLPVSVVTGPAVVTHSGPPVPLPPPYAASGFYLGQRGLSH
jgi:hypothetical protein